MEICTIGGYEEVGKNMTAVKSGDDVIIFDLGVHLPSLIELQEKGEQGPYSEKKLRKQEALPDDRVLDKLGWRKKVRAIVIGHAHLDHVGAAHYLAKRYPQAEILATPFTMEVMESLAKEDEMKLKNKKRKIKPDSTETIKGKDSKLKLEFINATHSIPGCVFAVWHTQEGGFFYALDFKFDEHPVMGKPSNYKRLKELGKAGDIKAMSIDALYSDAERRTPSERIARNLIQEGLSYVRDKDSALFVTTFSSHIARLKSIVDYGKKTKREIVFIGRSLYKYVNCAIKTGICPFKDDIKLLKYRKQINGFLKKVQKNPGKYMVVCTGHQGEPGSILDRVVNGETPFEFKSGDHVLFSSSVIPVPVHINARAKLDKKLKSQGVRLQTDLHVSGHGGREDLRDMIEFVKPKHILAAHGSLEQETPLITMATDELGYKFQKTAHLSSNGNVLKI